MARPTPQAGAASSKAPVGVEAAAGALNDAHLDRVAGGDIKQDPGSYINPDGSVSKAR